MRALLATLVLLSTPAIADPKFEVKDNRLVVPGPVVFATGKDTLLAKSDAVLDHVKAYLDAKPYISLLRIENHSDSLGNAKYNQTLSESRALAVAKALVAKGVDCKRLVAVGFGDTKPVGDNKTPEGRAQNRRTEFVNAELKGRAIGGMPVDGGGKVAGRVCP